MATSNDLTLFFKALPFSFTISLCDLRSAKIFWNALTASGLYSGVISSINFWTFSSIGFGIDLGRGTGLDFWVLGFGTGFGATYFVGFRGSGNILINFDPSFFALGKNFIFY